MKRAFGQAFCVLCALATFGASGCPQTKVELSLHGGFAYVRNSNTVEVGFMKSWHEGAGPDDCNVDQGMVMLKVDDGQIVTPPNAKPAINVTNAVVQFDGVGTSNVEVYGVLGAPLSSGSASTSAMNAAASRGPGGQTRPKPPRTREKDWEDLFWVPHTRLSYWNRQLDPQWRINAVTGRLVLAGGRLTAGIPSDGGSVHGIWEFRNSAGMTAHQQAITDRLRYRTSVSAAQLTINVTDGTGTTTYVVAPLDSRKTVGLILAGEHLSGGPIPVGGKLDHFCTYYQMIKDDVRPAGRDRLVPYFVGGSASTATAATGAAQPTPGLFCPGDWP